jgi:hypothetical protein
MYNEIYFSIFIIALLKPNMFVDNSYQLSPSISSFSFLHSRSPKPKIADPHISAAPLRQGSPPCIAIGHKR